MGDYSTLSNPKFCSYEGCGRKHYGKGLCHTHYQQKSRGIELQPIDPLRSGHRTRKPKKCSFPECEKPSRQLDLCSGHANQKRRGQELRPLRARRANGTVASCSFEGCRNNTTGGAFELCRGHYRQKRLGRELESLPDWNDNLARDDDGRKKCAGCRSWLPTDSFHQDAHRPDGMQTRCRECLRGEMLLRTYGITPGEYDRMLSGQGGGCAICGVEKSPDMSSLAVDHDHRCCPGSKSCGRCVRGLLCLPCNQGLGNFRDRTDLLGSAALYLDKFGTL